MLASVEGSIFYNIGGYVLPFYINSGLLVIVIPIMYHYIPNN